jgi:hypothetical protein
MGFEVLTAVKINITVVWDVTPRSLVHIVACLLKARTVKPAETAVTE